MEFKQFESQTTSHSTFMYDAIYFQSPDEFVEEGDGDWEDEEDESFDDEAEDLDDLNAERMGDDLETSDDAYDITNPDPDDDHLPEEELQ
jgi:hypothetical protein